MNETSSSLDKIKHPCIKAVLNKYHKDDKGLEIVHSSDIPGLSGLGSSSAFTISMLNLIHKFNNTRLTKEKLVKKCIDVEHNILKSHRDIKINTHVPMEDLIPLSTKNQVNVNSIKIKKNNLKNLISNSILVYSGIQRKSEVIEKDKVKNLIKNKQKFKDILEISKEAKKILETKNKLNIRYIADLLNDSWAHKQQLSQYVSNPKIDELYRFGLNNGAMGGKLLGAGGGGYILFLSKDKISQNRLIKSLKKNVYFKFEIDQNGSQIL